MPFSLADIKVVPAGAERPQAPTVARPLKVAFSFYAPEGAQLSMPLAVFNGLLRRHAPHCRIDLLSINKTLPAEQCSLQWFRDEIARLQPDLLAVSCMSPHWRHMRAYLEVAKAASPRTVVLVGGYQAILSPEETIAHPAVDLICVGDGEQALLDLVNCLQHDAATQAARSTAIAGLWEKRADGSVLKGERVLSEDLNAYPFPDYSIFERNGSLRGLGISVFGPQDKFILPVMTGRGCPYKCTYCSNTPLLDMYKGGEGSYIRKYDADALVDELVALRDRYQVEYFEFWDELFMVNVRYSLDFFERYRQRVGLPFSINARVERMDEDFCRAAREAGCHTIWFGIESGSEPYRTERLGRKMHNADVLRAAQHAKQFGIRRLTFNIVGMPYETLADAEQTLALNQAIAPEFFYFFIYIPLEGTPLYSVAEKGDLLIAKDEVSSDYLEGLRSNTFRSNLRQHPGGMSSEEFNAVCVRMATFQRENNRLDFNVAQPPPAREQYPQLTP